jgi:hypothetical protein
MRSWWTIPSPAAFDTEYVIVIRAIIIVEKFINQRGKKEISSFDMLFRYR